MLPRFAQLLDNAIPMDSRILVAPDVAREVGLTLYRSSRRWFIDVNNTALDLEKDIVRLSTVLKMRLKLPPGIQEQRLNVQVISPETGVEAKMEKDNDAVEIRLSPIQFYASIMLETN